MNANFFQPTAQLRVLEDMESWLSNKHNEDDREKLNNAIFSIANKMGVHPHDLAIYILIRTASL